MQKLQAKIYIEGGKSFEFEITNTARLTAYERADEIVSDIIIHGYKDKSIGFIEYFPPHKINSVTVFDTIGDDLWQII